LLGFVLKNYLSAMLNSFHCGCNDLRTIGVRCMECCSVKVVNVTTDILWNS